MAWVKTLVSSPTMNTESQLESETDSETTHEPVNVEEINSVRPFAELFKEELARSVSLDNPILGLEGQSPGSRRRFSAFGSSRRNDSLQNNGTTPMKSYQKLFGSLPDVESENNTEREISNSIVNSHADSSASTKNVSRNYFSDDDNDSPASNDSNNSFNSLPDSAYHITKAIYLKRFKYRIKLRSKRASYNNATLEVAKFRFKISLSMKYVKKWFRFKVDHKEYSSFLVSIRAFSEEKALSRLLMNWFVWTKQRSDNAVGSKLCIDQVNRAKQKSALKALKIHTTYRLGCKVLDDDRAEVKHYKRYRLVSSLASLYDNITFRQTAETVSNTAGEYYRFVMIRKLFNVWNRRISERISRQKALIQVESDIDSAVDSEKESILDIPFDAKVQQPSLNASPESSDSGSEMERAEDMNSDYNSKSVSESGFDSRSYQIDETSDGNSNSSCSPVVEEVHDEVPDIVEQNDCESLPPPPPYEDEIFPLPEVELSDGGSGKAVHEKVYDLKSSYSFDIGYSGSYDDFGSSFGSSSAYNYGSRNLFDSLNSHTSISTFGSLGNSKILYSRKADEKVDLFYRKNCSERSLLHLYLYKEQKKKCSIDILKAIEYNFLKKVSDALDVWSNYQLTKHSMKEMNYYCKSRSNRKTLTHAFHKFARFRGDGIKRSIIYYNRKKVSDGLTTIYKFYIVNQSQYNKYRKGKQYFFYTKGKKYLTIWRARVALNLQRTSSKPLKGNLSYYQSQKLCQAFDRIRIFISYTKSYRLQLTKADCISERKIQKKYFKLWCTFLVNELLEKEQVTLPSPEPVCSESCIEGNFEVLQTIANASEEIVEEIVYDSLIGTLEEINQSPSCDYPTINRMPAVSDDSIIDEDTVDYTYEFQLSANATFSRSSSDVKDAGDTQVSPGSNTEVYDVSTSYSPNSSLGNSATSNSALSSSKRLLESRSERIAADYYRDALMIKGLARLQQFYQRVLPEKILVEDMDDYYIIRLKFQSFQLFIARTLRSRRHQMI